MQGTHEPLRVAVTGSDRARDFHERTLGRLPLACVAELREADAVVVGGDGTDLALAAIQAGRHVYVADPFALSATDLRRIAVAAGRARTVAGAGLVERFDPLYERARALLHEGVVGDLLEVSLIAREPAPPFEIAARHTDLIGWLTGDSVRWSQQGDLEGLRGVLEGGADVEARFTRGAERRCGFIFAGDNGWLAIDRCARRIGMASGQRAQLRSLPTVEPGKVVARSIAAWVRHITGARREEPPTPDEAAETLASLEGSAARALRRSAALRG